MATGLRERKKQQTRELIAETARRLFSERGFERVSVAEIARVADVSEKTVFNYFPTKEDLVYWRLESFEDELLARSVRRAAGESVLDAFGRFVRQPRGMLGQYDRAARERLAALDADDRRESVAARARAADLRGLHRVAGRADRRGDRRRARRRRAVGRRQRDDGRAPPADRLHARADHRRRATPGSRGRGAGRGRSRRSRCSAAGSAATRSRGREAADVADGRARRRTG